MILKEDFDATAEALRPNINLVKQAIQDILANDALPDILNLILRVGNFLNFGSHAGNAEAFKITSLLKLTDTRANKPRMNLLHFVVQMAEEKKNSLLDFPEKMPVLAEACRLNVDTLEAEVAQLKKNLDTTKKRLETSTDDLKEQFSPFIRVATEESLSLQTGITDIRDLTQKFAEYFCEDPKKFVLEDYLKVFHQFCEALSKAKEENENFKKIEARRVAREKKAAEEAARKAALGIVDEPKKKKGRIPPPKEEKCIIDNLLDEVRNGFPLKKLNMNKEAAPGPISRQVSTKDKWSKLNIQKTRVLAQFLMSAKQPQTLGVKSDVDSVTTNESTESLVVNGVNSAVVVTQA